MQTITYDDFHGHEVALNKDGVAHRVVSAARTVRSHWNGVKALGDSNQPHDEQLRAIRTRDLGSAVERLGEWIDRYDEFDHEGEDHAGSVAE